MGLGPGFDAALARCAMLQSSPMLPLRTLSHHLVPSAHARMAVLAAKALKCADTVRLALPYGKADVEFNAIGLTACSHTVACF